MIFNPPILPHIIDVQPNEVYHSHENFISSTRLKKMAESPMHFKLNIQTKETAAMMLGTLVHTLVLEPHNFEIDYAIKKKVNGTTTAGKLYNAEFEVNNYGKIIINTEVYNQGKCMADAICNNPQWKKLTEDVTIEQSLYWQDELSKVYLRCRPDVRLRRKKIIIDLKTSEEATPDACAKSCGEYDYPMSAALYTEGVSQCLQRQTEAYLFCFVEKNEPYGVSIIQLLEADLEAARARMNKYLNDIKICTETGIWPGYEYHAPALNKGIQELKLPGWYKQKFSYGY